MSATSDPPALVLAPPAARSEPPRLPVGPVGRRFRPVTAVVPAGATSPVRTVRMAAVALLAFVAPATITACESTVDAPASISLRFQERAPLTRDRLVVTVTDGRNEWYFEGADLEPADGGWLASRTLRLATNSGVRVTVAFRGSGATPVAGGDVFVPSSSHERWRVDVFASELLPEVACAGCAGIARFTIADGSRPAAHDWLYLRWTSTSTTLTGPP